MRTDPPHVDRVRQLVKRAVDPVQRVAVAQVHGPAPPGPQVVDRLRQPDERVKLDRPRRPAGHVLGQQFQQRQRALAPPVADGVGHLAARDQDLVAQLPPGRRHLPRLARLVDDAVANQVADVRHDPILARLDEPVFVQPGDVGLDDVHLLGDHAQQRPQRVPLFGVALAVDDRQQFVQAVR